LSVSGIVADACPDAAVAILSAARKGNNASGVKFCQRLQIRAHKKTRRLPKKPPCSFSNLL
jgi:hypothetical protein